MEINEISLKVKSLCCSVFCKVNNHRIIDSFGFFSCEFKSNNIYGIINSFGSGGQALMSVLAGYEKFFQGEIIYNGRRVNHNDLKDITYIIENQPLFLKKRNFKNNTVLSYLEKAIKNNPNFNDSLENVIKQFGLVRLNHDIRHTSGEQWRILFALGYCMGKKIFCFNWMNYWNLRFFKNVYKQLFNYIKEKGCIIIIPTDKSEGIEDLFDETFHIGDSEEYQITNNLI